MRLLKYLVVAVAAFAAMAFVAALPGVARAMENPAQPAAGNLVRNPSFAEGLAHWTPEGLGDATRVEPAVDASVSRAGDGAALKIPAQPGKRTRVHQIGIPRDPHAKKYRFSVWTRAKNLSADWVARFGVEQSRGTQVLATLHNYHVSCAAIHDWGRTVIEFEPPPKAEEFSVYLGVWYDGKGMPAPPGGEGAVWFDDVSLRPVLDDETLRRAVRVPHGVAVESFHPLGQRGLFLPGEPIRLSLVGKNHGASGVDLVVAVEVRDFQDGLVARQTDPLAVAAGAPFERSIELAPPARRGFFCVKAALKQQAQPLASAATGFCVVQPVEDKDPFFGIDPNGLTTDLLDALGMIGVGSLGIHAPWALSKEEMADVKGAMERRVEKHLGPLLRSKFNLVGYVKIDPEFHPQWIRQETRSRREKGLFPYPDALFQLLGDAAEAEASVMKARVRTWIIQEEIDAWANNPNAPAGSGMCELARHVLSTRIVSRRLKKVDPSFVVAGLSVYGDFRSDPPYALVRRLLPDLRSELDLLAPDPYCGAYDFTTNVISGPELAGFRAALLETQRLQTEFGKTKELIIAEKGLGVPYHVPPDDSTNKTLANFTARNLIVAKSVGPVRFYSHYVAAGSTAWQIQDRGYPSDDEHPAADFGMWKRTLDRRGRQYYQPRSVVAAYATVARILAGAVDPAELHLRDGFHGYLFSRKDRTVVALWTTEGEPRRMRIAMPADCELWDLMGNARALPAGEAELTVGQSPSLLVSPGDRKAIATAIQQAGYPGTVAAPVSAYESRSATE